MTQTITGLFDHYDDAAARSKISKLQAWRTATSASSAMTGANKSVTTVSAMSPIPQRRTPARAPRSVLRSAASAVC